MTTRRHAAAAFVLSFVVTLGLFASVAGLATPPQAGALLAQTDSAARS
jgi:hypothetical protein